jgi:Domain of unknown function (DUF1737)
MVTSRPKRPDEPEDKPQERLVLGIDRTAPRRHYRIVSAPIHSLEAVLSKWLADGWEPLGGPSIDSRDGTMYQAIIKTV